MRILSKSKLLAFRQCPKRLWLEVYRPELLEYSSSTKSNFSRGYQVGDLAQKLYDTAGDGRIINFQEVGVEKAIEQSTELLKGRQPIFEAGFQACGALAFADVMLPVNPGSNDWRMVEVKSSTSVKDYYRDDAAIQAFIARSMGISLVSISLAHINSRWVYSGEGDYSGILVEEDLSQVAFSRSDEVCGWIRGAQTVLECELPPEIGTGAQCSAPHDCGFLNHCRSTEPQADKPLAWLPGRLSSNLIKHIQLDGLTEINDVPDDMLNDKQLRVKEATISGVTYFDLMGSTQALKEYKLPAFFLDFETIQFAVPIWAGTRPYQQIPFQFSVHKLYKSGRATQIAFLDISGRDPRRAFSTKLIEVCENTGPIFVYNAAFEKTRIKEMADQFPELSLPLLALNERIVDLLPIARDCYYNPSQQGSWSIKAVLPALCPDLKYSELEGVQNGGMAMECFLEAIAVGTSSKRKQAIEKQLLAYCELDTYAMVRMWAAFTNSVVD